MTEYFFLDIEVFLNAKLCSSYNTSNETEICFGLYLRYFTKFRPPYAFLYFYILYEHVNAKVRSAREIVKHFTQRRVSVNFDKDLARLRPRFD